MSKKIFVAGPYNCPDPVEKESRLNEIKNYCLRMFLNGDSPISALLMGLVYANHGTLPTDTDTWRTFSITLLKGCDELHVLKIEGWELSSGVQSEIDAAEKLGIIIRYIEL